MTKVIMVQGTSSDAGKSIIATALCRIFKQDGYKVAPFKAQNMALNAFVTVEGGEIGRAQAEQAEAAGIIPSVHMNPVLLKPEADSRSQIIVHGKAVKTISAALYHNYAPSLLGKVEESFNYLKERYDVIVIEGAGSPAEINIKEKEIVNMRIAKMAGAPVLLVADIDRGGVFASLVGTLELMSEDERRYFKGFIINKFRGDSSLLNPGIAFLENKTGVPLLGIIPYFRDISIAQEDSVFLDNRVAKSEGTDLDIAVIRLPRISNYDDFDPLEKNGGHVRYVNIKQELGNPHLIILPGTKSTISDLGFLKSSGLANQIKRLHHSGTPIIGICGGYQMLGKQILDPGKIEGGNTRVAGLGLLDSITTFTPYKATTQVKAVAIKGEGLLEGSEGLKLSGYEIHIGRTINKSDCSAFTITETPTGKTGYSDGSINQDSNVLGTYIHGIFHNTAFTYRLLNNIRRWQGLEQRNDAVTIDKEIEYDKLAQLVRQNLDMGKVYSILNEGLQG